MNKKMCIWAGIFVVAMFLFTTVPTNAVEVLPLGMQQAQAQQTQQVQGVQYSEEQTNFPPTLPDGTSSLTCVVKRRAFDLWNGIVYDVGYSIYIMKKTDGQPHTWNFDGTLQVYWRAGNAPETIPVHLSTTWNMYLPLGFRIQSAGTYPLPPFYMAHLSATVIKDMGTNEQFEKDFCGFYYYYQGGIVPQVQEQTETVVLG